MDLKFDPDNPNYEYITSMNQAKIALEDLLKEPVIAIDTETTGLDPYYARVLLIQIGKEDKAYVFDMRQLDPEIFRDILEDPKRIKIIQNAKFDYQMIKANWNISMTNIYDTMLAERILKCGLERRNSLKAIVERHTGIVLEKAIAKTFESVITTVNEAQIRYAALDILVLFPVFHKQWELLQQANMVSVAKLEFATVRVVGDMELNGVRIDQDKWQTVVTNLEVKRAETAKAIQEMIRPYYHVQQFDLFGGMADAINLNSQQQLLDLFNNRLNLHVPSTGDAILETINHPVAKIIREYRGYEKLISAFGVSILEKVNKKTGRLHPDFQQIGADTGRFSCSNPNLQQIPRESEIAPFRSCFTPAPGYTFVVADYSSMEMRIVADFTGDENLIKAFDEGWDVHSATAALMFNKEYTPSFKKEFPELRQAAKTINFGLVYGMGPGRLGAAIGVDMDTAKDYMSKYFQTFKNVKIWLDSAAKKAVTQGYSETPIGRKRYYLLPDKTNPDRDKILAGIERQGKNHPIQGANADATKYALVFLQDKLKDMGVDGKVILTVHDEIVCEIREDQAEDWAKVQQEQMERGAKLFMKKCKPVAEAVISHAWEH